MDTPPASILPLPAEGQLTKSHLENAWRELHREAEAIAALAENVRQEQREFQAERELSRRQLAAEWQTLRHEQLEWQEEHRRASRQLERRERAVKEREDQLIRLQRHNRRHISLRATEPVVDITEANYLEQRLAHTRQRLYALQQEAANYEHLIQRAAALLAGDPPVVASGGVDQSNLSGIGLDELLDRIQDLINDVAHHHRRLRETQEKLLDLREGWQIEWDRALARLVEHQDQAKAEEQALADQKAALQQWTRQLQGQAESLAVRQKQLQVWESRLLREELALRVERDRVADQWSQRSAMADLREKQAARLRAWAKGLRQETQQRCQRLIKQVVEMRRKALNAIVATVERERQLNAKDLALAARELVVAKAEQVVLQHDPKPLEAAKELRERAKAVREAATRDENQLKSWAAELAVRQREQDEVNRRLAAQRQRLEERLLALNQREQELLVERVRRHQERDGLTRSLALLRQERDRQVALNRELKDQLDRLSLLLLESSTPSQQPVLAAAA